MQKRNILFRADSSSAIGTGHIMRDLVLAQQYTDSEVIFAVQALQGNINHKIQEQGHEVVILQSNDVEELVALVRERAVDWVVIDHYGIDYAFEKNLKEQTGASLLVLDDTYEKHCCDILLNHNISADERKYKGLLSEGCEVRCGEKYTLLRDEFREEKGIKRDKVYDVLIAMGGADTANLNIPILDVLPPHFKVAVITTTANENLEKLKEYIVGKQHIILYVNSNEVAKLMNESRLAIVTPSVTVNEAYYMGLDFIAIKTADNQDEMHKYLCQEGYNVLNTFNVAYLLKYTHRILGIKNVI